jgi:hypothetical protein
MPGLAAIGEPPWTRDELRAALKEFAELYGRRPIRDNAGGMKAPHLFSAWFGLRRLKPRAIVESGIWLGQGTWFFERACPEAELYCIDVNLERIQYRSPKARYFDRDFATLDCSALPREETVLFFDDHQNAYARLMLARWLNFRHVFFEDNYPPGQGDCYSLKKAFAQAGFQPAAPSPRSAVDRLKGQLRRLLGVHDPAPESIPANAIHAACLRDNLEVYYEFPPVAKRPTTRWGDAWTADRYPTPEPLLERLEAPFQQVYFDEAADYTWICYTRLKACG